LNFKLTLKTFDESTSFELSFFWYPYLHLRRPDVLIGKAICAARRSGTVRYQL